jgi:dimethylhistidine N-methyltransferase
MTYRFHDCQPEFDDFHHSVISGLSASPKQIAPKFFYDEVGSKIFDAICDQPEYYVPAVERSIFETHAEDILASLQVQDCHLIEPGAGSSVKVRFLLDRVRPAMYVPMDISAEHLRASAARLAADYPGLPVHAVCVDHTKPYALPSDIPATRRVFFYPGSSLGNFDPAEAIRFLRDLRSKAGDDGRLLIGIDTKKPADVLNLAYNDPAGVTAAFNLNLLERLRKELASDVDPARFEHRAFYNAARGRIEMHLVSREAQRVRVNGNAFDFQAGESIHTENSYKYTPDELRQLAWDAGWAGEKVWLDDKGYFSVHLLKARPGACR